VYTGFLYAGIMVAADGTPKVLEFNCRFGDPETQPIMMRLKNSIVELCIAGTMGVLDQTMAYWDDRPAVGVVLAAQGYPDNYPKGDVINLPEETDRTLRSSMPVLLLMKTVWWSLMAGGFFVLWHWVIQWAKRNIKPMNLPTRSAGMVCFAVVILPIEPLLVSYFINKPTLSEHYMGTI